MRVKAFIFVVLILLGGKIFTVDATEKHTIDIIGIELISPYRCNLTIGFKSWGDPFYSLDIRSPDLLYITNENINPKDYEDKSYITYTITSLFTDTDYEFVITSHGEFAAKSEILTFNSHDFLSKIQVNNNEIPRSGIVYYEPNRSLNASPISRRKTSNGASKSPKKREVQKSSRPAKVPNSQSKYPLWNIWTNGTMTVMSFAIFTAKPNMEE